MKDSGVQCYNSPKVEILMPNQEDVICTSFLPFAKFNLGKKSWNDQWLTDWTGVNGLNTEVN